jgi:hypothetical protein
MYSYTLPDPKWEQELWKCCACGIIDRPVYTKQADAEGQPIFEHSVVPDVTFLSRDKLTARELEQGYKLMQLEGGRRAKVRLICRECLESDEQAKGVWRDLNKARQEREGGDKPSNFYQILCGE